MLLLWPTVFVLHGTMLIFFQIMIQKKLFAAKYYNIIWQKKILV